MSHETNVTTDIRFPCDKLRVFPFQTRIFKCATSNIFFLVKGLLVNDKSTNFCNDCNSAMESTRRKLDKLLQLPTLIRSDISYLRTHHSNSEVE